MEAKQTYIELLQAYLSQLKGDFNSAEESLLCLQPDIETEEIYNIATWTWLLQRQIGLTSDNKKIAIIDYESYIAYLTKEWEEVHEGIWGTGSKDIYLSNISMVYAALLETKNNRGSFSLQKVMTDIRDFVFNNLLSGGTALNGVHNRTISVDQTLAVMPFGLFSPEDLAIVEATQKMILHLEEDGGLLPYRGAQESSASATAMIALYYLEKSEKEKAFHYAQQVQLDKGKDELADIILNIFDHYAAKENHRDQIIHEPLGNENVYISQLTERIPHYPTLDDYTQIACQVVSQSDIDSVVVEMENEAKTWRITKNLLSKFINGTAVYRRKIDPLPDHDRYSYRFIAKLLNGKELRSKKYMLTTRKKNETNSLHLLEKKDKGLLLGLGQDNAMSISLREDGMNISIQQQAGQMVSERDNEEPISLDVGEYRLEVEMENPRISLFKGESRLLSTHPLYAPFEWRTDVEGIVREFNINWYTPKEEKFYGFGERYNAIEQRGEVIDCYVYNQYRDQGTRTYIPIPFYMTNTGYGCFVNTANYTKFDLASELKDKCTVTFEQDSMVTNTDIHFYFGDYKKQLKAYTEVTGKPAMVPAWALGPWMSSNNWDRQSIVEGEVKTTNKHSIPATVIVLEQWSDEATYYMFNDATYELKEPGHVHGYAEMSFPSWGRWPDPKGMVEKLHDENLKLILWQIPIQKYLNNQKHPLKDQDEAYMIENGYVVKNEDGSPYRIPENWFTNSLVMDFSNEAGKKWWFDKRQYLLDIGVDGFKTDGGEFIFGKNLQFANGQTGSEMRNQYPNDYIEAYYNFAQQNNGITFSRAGYISAQNFPAHWAGDERSTFDAFKRSLVAGINAGLAGIVFWGWDLAGFNGEIPTAELFMRSSSMAAFCPIMQYHAESKAEFSQDRTPWNIAARTGEEKVIDVYRFFANVRMNLIPYLYQESKIASETGIPLMRALMIDYPDDSRVDGLYDEYLFGQSLLVAPIIEENTISRKVYLPKGRWVDLWGGKVYQGPTVVLSAADVDQIPVFARMNHALLLNVNDTKQWGSSVGNDISQYQVPLCKIYCDASFNQKLEDHLGNTVELSVEVSDEEITVRVQTDIKGLHYDVIGSDKPLHIINVKEGL
ncbi:glycoside hydrolase family 31 protein [Virgibacillus sp. L01]|uniref:glycoside hydrolase family 31 protein n=1 Tax=Virgibacillus sp. L01 TaxID=3457429 RepID=UPI003FD41F03